MHYNVRSRPGVNGCENKQADVPGKNVYTATVAGRPVQTGVNGMGNVRGARWAVTAVRLLNECQCGPKYELSMNQTDNRLW